MWKKLKALITKDVDNANEVKMYSVIMRLIILTFFAYNFLCLMYGAAYKQYVYMLVSIVYISFSILFFSLTYSNNTKNATIGTWIMLCSVMIIHPIFYGYDTGVFQMLYILILIIFTVDYLSKRVYKFIALFLTIALRCGLYAYFMNKTPLYVIDGRVNFHWRAVHLIAFSIMESITIIIATADFSAMRQKLMNTNKSLRDVASRDPLTGLYNRRQGQTYMQERIQEYNIGTISSITLAMADVDFFKRVNDTYGHDNGDEVLKTLANTIGAFMRGKGVPIRWGGEEFVLVFVNFNGDETYELLCELQSLIAKNVFDFDGNEVRVTLTYGVAEYGGGDTIDDMIKEADEKLYIGKEKGRNIIIF